MTYQDLLNQHLASYKRTSLGVDAPGSYAHKGKVYWYDHILPEEMADLNLLPGVLELERVHGLRATRHQYFRHLNSSQAFAFNLFLPFFSGGAVSSSVLLRALGQEGSVESWELEAIPEPEEGSNLDAVWVGTDRNTTICEVKLSEGEFGKAEADDRHRDKLERIYRRVLSSHVDATMLEEPLFFEHYQVLRNIYHLLRSPGGRLLFLLPRENAGLWKKLPPILARVAPATRLRIRVLAIEDVIAALAGDGACPPELRVHVAAFAAKYLPAA